MGAPSSGKRKNPLRIQPTLAGIFSYQYIAFNPHSNPRGLPLLPYPFHSCGRRDLKTLDNGSKVTAGQRQNQDWAGSVCTESPVLSHPPGPLFQMPLRQVQWSPIIPYQPTSIHSFTLPPSLNRLLVGSTFPDKARPSPAARPCRGCSSLGLGPLKPLQCCSQFTLVTGLRGEARQESRVKRQWQKTSKGKRGGPNGEFQNP